MKKNILLSMSAALLILASCDYNEDNFPGYDELAHAKDVQNITLTLADGEYKKVADNATNKELAISKDPTGETYLKELEAVGKNKFFTEDAPAALYLPAYIDGLYPYLSDGSKVTVNYKNFENLPDYLTDFNNVETYELSTSDYQTVWGESLYAPFLSPSTLGQIPTLLANSVPTPGDGAMRLVNYAYSETEPSTGGGGGPVEPTYTNIADALAAGEGSYDVKGEVVAANAQSILVKDDTGIIMVHLRALPTYSLGDVVTVSGAISPYGGFLQFSETAVIEVVERNTSFAYPTTPKNMTAADMDAYLNNQKMEYVTYEGTLSISNNKYFNVAIEGAETAIGSIQYPVAIDKSLSGKKVKVTGYAVGVSSGKYVNTLTTSVVAADGTSTSTTPVGVIALSKAGTYTARGVVSATHTRGFVLTDGTGDILVYENKMPTGKIGDIVLVSGLTNERDGLMQFGSSPKVTVESNGSTAPGGLKAQVMDGEAMDAYSTDPRAVYASYTGTLSIKDSGNGFNYFNVAIDGAATSSGSLSYVDESTVDKSLNGKKVIVTGYLIGVNKGRVNTMITSLVDASAANIKAFGLTRAASPAPTASAVYRYDATADMWKKYSTSGVKIAALQPADYTTIGSSYVDKANVTLPIYLQRNYPYAKKDDVIAAVYYADKDMTIAASEFVFDGAAWNQTTVAVESKIVFLKGQGKWTEAKVYYSSSMLDGDDGGFTIQDVELSDLKKVWESTTGYGWKATGYSGGNKETESWIVSPEISLKKSVMPVLKFDAAVNYLKGGELQKYFNVLVSTDYESDVTKATWKELTVTGWPKEDSWTFVTVDPVDMSAYKDQNIYVAFRYRSDTAVATTIEVKNMSIQE